MGLTSGIIRALNAFFAVNRKVCRRLEVFLPQAKTSIFDQYIQTVTGVVNGRPRNAVVIDVGGGKRCPFAHSLKGAGHATIIAVDISEDELRHNNDVNGKLVADIVQRLPFRSRTVDLITSSSVLEHIQDVRRFVIHSSEVLKPDGYCVHLFPSKFAPFALLNQLLKGVSRAVVHFFLPESKGICGFPAVYNECYYSAIRNLLLNNGFELIEVKPSYYQSPYFDFCFPLFAVSAAYEVVVKLLGLRNLAAYLLVVARRMGA
jgi:ubiquinone/menaquinone biosynthesis C-methylase UbiE